MLPRVTITTTEECMVNPETLVAVREFGVRRMADELDCSPSFISQWLNCNTSMTGEMFHRLLDVLNGIKIAEYQLLRDFPGLTVGDVLIVKDKTVYDSKGRILAPIGANFILYILSIEPTGSMWFKKL